MKKTFAIPVTFLVILFCSCQKEIAQEDALNAAYKLKVTFKHTVGDKAMQLGSTYQNPFNETYTLTAFKYYISNISLPQSEGSALTVPDVYHLVNEADDNSKSFILFLNKNQFNRIVFLIGVDSTRNVSGTQSGDLDPAKGMFWTWNSGYIMAKMEANSPASTAPANKVEIHVGGFKTGENALRTVTLDLAAGSIINIKENGTSEIIIEADANKWFNAAHNMKIADFPVCTSPGTVALDYADNYAKMFTVISVNN